MQKLRNISYRLLAISCLLYGCKDTQNVTKSTEVSGNKLPIQTIDLPVFIPDSLIQKQLYQSLFEAGKGKYYPCVPPHCDAKFKDIYLENPVISVTGNLVSIKVHIAGNIDLSFLKSGISEDITLTAKPQVQNDTLYFRNVTLQHSSKNLLLNLTSILFENTIKQKIQQYAWYSFHPLLNTITSQAKKEFPIKWQGAVLLLNLNAIHLKSVSFQLTPDEGILVDFSADLETENSSYAK